MKERLTMLLVALFLSVGVALAQNTISGTVLEEDGEPLIGATVMVQGTKQGTQTDTNGRFSISVPAGKKIVISYIGLVSQTLTPKNGMKVTLHSDAHNVGEVVVTGIQKMDKRLFTGATTKIDAEQTKLDGVADVTRSLEAVLLVSVCRTYPAPSVLHRRSASVVQHLSMVRHHPSGWSMASSWRMP